MATNNAINLKGPTPAFFAYMPIDTGAIYTPGGTVVFPSTRYDTTSSYNTSTGDYIVPATGIYNFTSSLFIRGITATTIQITVTIYNVTTNVFTYIFYELCNPAFVSDPYTPSGSALLFATKNDQIHVTFAALDVGSTVYLAGSGYNQTWFSGYMITQV